MKLLIIDPKPERSRAVVDLLHDKLRGADVQIKIAPSGFYALTMLERACPDVVMARSQIGDMSGLELCSMVRSDDSLSGVRVVLVAQTEEERRQAIATSSVDEVWTGLAPTLVHRLLQLLELGTKPVKKLVPPGSMLQRPSPQRPSPQRLSPQRLSPQRPSPQRPSPQRPGATLESAEGTGNFRILQSEFSSLLGNLDRKRKTGFLTVLCNQAKGVILFKEGRARHAEFLRFRGIPAFTKLLAEVHKAGRADCRFEDAIAGETEGYPDSIEMTVDKLLIAAEMNFLETVELPELGKRNTRASHSPRSLHRKTARTRPVREPGRKMPGRE